MNEYCFTKKELQEWINERTAKPELNIFNSANGILQELEEFIDDENRYANPYFSKKSIELENAVKTLAEYLKNDDEFFFGWQSNIAMTMYDAWMKDKVGENVLDVFNNGAIGFLNLLIRETLKEGMKDKG